MPRKDRDITNFINKLLVKYADKKEAELSQNIGNSGIVWMKFRKQYFNDIYIRDKGRCLYCTSRVKRDEATLDHCLSPLRGGLNTLENVVLSCHWCNQDKSILTVEEYAYKQLANANKGIYHPLRSPLIVL